jgi:hypothetical protein
MTPTGVESIRCAGRIGIINARDSGSGAVTMARAEIGLVIDPSEHLIRAVREAMESFGSKC